MTDDAPTAENRIESWHIEGLILMCKDGPHGTDSGIVTTEELLKFAQAAHQSWPGAPVLVHQYGLRVTNYESSPNSPRLDWREW